MEIKVNKLKWFILILLTIDFLSMVSFFSSSFAIPSFLFPESTFLCEDQLEAEFTLAKEIGKNLLLIVRKPILS